MCCVDDKLDVTVIPRFLHIVFLVTDSHKVYQWHRVGYAQHLTLVIYYTDSCHFVVQPVIKSRAAAMYTVSQKNIKLYFCL